MMHLLPRFPKRLPHDFFTDPPFGESRSSDRKGLYFAVYLPCGADRNTINSMILNSQIDASLDIAPSRLIGWRKGIDQGPLLIVIGGIHGNETAGVQALFDLFDRMDREPTRNPRFKLLGNIVGLRGNVGALRAGTRYLDRDMNRLLTPATLAKARTGAIDYAEEREFLELHEAIATCVEYFRPDSLHILDLHTTTAFGGTFSITSDDPRSEAIAKGLYAPVVRGILTGIGGTTLHFFNDQNMGLPTTTIVFESGQHDDPISVDYATSAIINCMRTIGCVAPIDVEAKHDNLLKRHFKQLPNVVELVHTHHIQPGDAFVMRPGYENFQPIAEGEHLADDRNGRILAPCDGLILMPLYQAQGEDGFFVVRVVEP